MKLIRTIPKEGIYHREELLTPGDEKEGRERGLINIYTDEQLPTVIRRDGICTGASTEPHSIITVLY